jgi:hypothetical protein
MSRFSQGNYPNRYKGRGASGIKNWGVLLIFIAPILIVALVIAINKGSYSNKSNISNTISKSFYKSTTKNYIVPQVDETNLVLDLRKPIIIEFHDNGNSSVYLYPKGNFQIILPNGKILNLNTKIIREINIKVEDSKAATGLLDKLYIYYYDDLDFDVIVNELKNISTVFYGNSNSIENWIKMRDPIKNNTTPDIEYQHDDFWASLSLIEEQWYHGKKKYPLRIHYFDIELKTKYTDQLELLRK